MADSDQTHTIDLTVDPVPSDAPIDTKDEEHNDPNDAILTQMVERLDSSWSYWERNFRVSKEDVRFAYEDQWPAYAKKGRENRPQLTINMLPQYIHQTNGDARRAKFAIQIQQISGRNEPLRDPQNPAHPYSRSQVMEGLIRDIEDRSKAHDAYCRAHQHQVEGGFSHLLIKTVEDPMDPFEPELRIEHVKDRWSVLYDEHSMRDDFSDGMWCSMHHEMATKEFETRWPEVMVQDTPMGSNRHRQTEGSYWRGQTDAVRIVDYWWKEPMERTVVEFRREFVPPPPPQPPPQQQQGPPGQPPGRGGPAAPSAGRSRTAAPTPTAAPSATATGPAAAPAVRRAARAPRG